MKLTNRYCSPLANYSVTTDYSIVNEILNVNDEITEKSRCFKRAALPKRINSHLIRQLNHQSIHDRYQFEESIQFMHRFIIE